MWTNKKSTVKINYPIGAYAPGSYMSTCLQCSGEYLGDKYSRMCEPCSINYLIESEDTLRKENLHLKNQILKFKKLKEFLNTIELDEEE